MKKIYSKLFLFSLGLLLAAPTIADKSEKTYEERFLQAFTVCDPKKDIDEYASPKMFDELYMGKNLDIALTGINNDSAGIAWGISYLMMSINEMYKTTRDIKYLRAMRKAASAVLACRDDKRGVQLHFGVTAPVWSCLQYSERGRCAYPVHTGIITYPILDYLSLAASDSIFKSEIGTEYDEMLDQIRESLDFHNRQWNDGPNPDEGYYYGRDQEPSMDGKVLPANRLSSMGRALWLSSKLTRNKEHKDKALKIALFIRNRLSRNTTCDAYVWPYFLSCDSKPVESDAHGLRKEIGGGEDISHGSLTVSFTIIAASDGVIFNATDMARFGRTVTELIAPRDNGILFSHVDGNESSNPDKDLLTIPSRWLPLTPYCPRVYRRIANFLLFFEPRPHPLDMALLLRYRQYDEKN